MHVVSIVGARPQFVKAAPLSAAIRRQHRETLVHTGQHWDSSMSDAFFTDQALPSPDYNLGVRGGERGATIAKMVAALDPVLRRVAADAVIVFGDTNSTAAGAIAAAVLGVPIVHVEAGLRSSDRRMPEELNREMVDRLATLRCCPTPTAVERLASEGIRNGVHLVGDVQLDALHRTLGRAKDGKWHVDSTFHPRDDYVIATIHRAENTDDGQRLTQIVSSLNALPLKVVLPLHPRTQQACASQGLSFGQNVLVLEPLPHNELLRLARSARAVVTDSGGLQKEAYWLGVPCVTVRSSTEWVETVDTGWNRLCEPSQLPQALAAALTDPRILADRPPVLGLPGASERIVALLEQISGRS